MEDIRLPRNKKEGIIYGLTICIISVIIMASLNIILSFNRIDREVILIILKTIPVMVMIIFLLENILVGPISNKLVEKFTSKTDSVNAKILFNILFCVTLLSFIMTLVGPILGNGISMEILENFPSHWPRNFFFALWTELLLAQPLARKLMIIMHK